MYERTLKHAQFLTRHFGKDQMEYAVSAMLFELKIPLKASAFEYIKQAVMICFENPLIPATKELYPTVAMRYNPTIDPRSVEETIRSAVYEAWEERDDRVWSCYFQPDRFGRFPSPTNSDFIWAVMRFTKLWYGCCREVVICEKR